jgi:hypothetical protein
MRKDLRAQLENASEKVGELESKLLELKLENDSLKLTPNIFDDVDCPECDAWLNEIKLLNEKNASTLAKLDALRTEYDELKLDPLCLVLVNHVLLCMLSLLMLVLPCMH